MAEPCFLKIGCLPQIGCKPLHLPFNYDAFSPFVEAVIGAPGGPKVKVGNESYPSRPNTAIIKNMEFGYMDEPRLRMEIVDEAGGEMDVFVRALSKCRPTPVASEIHLKFGWVKSDCSKMDENSVITFDEPIELMLNTLDISFGGGLVKYLIEAAPIDRMTTNQREDVLYGPGMRLVDAIKRICETKNIIPVFAQVEADGNITARMDDVPWEWEGFGKVGPRASWQGDNTDVLTTISKWISSYRIKHEQSGAGILMVFDSKKYNHLVLWKDPKLRGTFSSCENVLADTPQNSLRRGSLGTFVVNGGKCSPVIRFDPKFNLISKMALKSTGGGANSSDDSKPVVVEDVEPPEEKNCVPMAQDDVKSTGQQQTLSTTNDLSETVPPERKAEEVAKSNMANLKANSETEFKIADIQAELTVIGMPTEMFVRQQLFLHSPVSIIVMNPFFVADGLDTFCGEWSHIVESGCNEVLSDRNYRCNGINHTIREGSFTTTLRVSNNNKSKTGIN